MRCGRKSYCGLGVVFFFGVGVELFSLEIGKRVGG